MLVDEFIIYFCSGFSMHYCWIAWLAAATVLNLNAWTSVSNASIDVQVPVAYLSGLIAFVVGGCMHLSYDHSILLFILSLPLFQ